MAYNRVHRRLVRDGGIIRISSHDYSWQQDKLFRIGCKSHWSNIWHLSPNHIDIYMAFLNQIDNNGNCSVIYFYNHVTAKFSISCLPSETQLLTSSYHPQMSNFSLFTSYTIIQGNMYQIDGNQTNTDSFNVITTTLPGQPSAQESPLGIFISFCCLKNINWNEIIMVRIDFPCFFRWWISPFC